jgi:signal transduction histidine kinase
VVSGTTSPAPETRRSLLLFTAWVGVLLGAAAGLLLVPSMEILGIEAVVLSFALLYGFGMWPVARTVVSILAFAAFAALVMVPRAQSGAVPDSELVEVVVPLGLAMIVIYHVRRREEALHRVHELAAADRRRARARERLSRMTSHELRTPLTIASGYVDHLLEGERDEERREDLLTVRDELEQLGRVCERLVRAVALDLGAPDAVTYLPPLLDEVRRRWAVVADRDVVVDCRAATVPVNAARLRAALDTLVENSVRYTRPGQRIRLFATEADGRVEVGVADAGPGLPPTLVVLVNSGADLPHAPGEGPPAAESTVTSPESLQDLYSRTGFGLRIVAAIAQSAGGRLVAGRGREGGARLALSVPVTGDRARVDYRTTRLTEAVRTSPSPAAVRTSP